MSKNEQLLYLSRVDQNDKKDHASKEEAVYLPLLEKNER